MVEQAATPRAPQVLVATEVGILHQLRALNSGTQFIPMNDRAACRYMKMITPAKLLQTLRTGEDRNSTRLNSSHANISYAVFFLNQNSSTSPLLSSFSLDTMYNNTLSV